MANYLEKMLPYTMFTCLWLTVNARLDFAWTDALTAPEMWNFTVTKVHYREEQSPHRLHVHVGFYEYGISSPHKECTLDLNGLPDTAAMNITAFRRLSDKAVALAWYREMAYGYNRQTKLTVVNMATTPCNRFDILQVSGDPILVPSTNRLDVFVNDEETCSGLQVPSPPCRIVFSLPALVQFKGNSPLEMDFDWSTIRIERLPSNDFVIRGLQGNTYRVMRMSDSTGKLSELMSLPDVDVPLEMISTRLTFCWILEPGRDRLLECRQFDDESNVIYSRSGLTWEPMTLLSVETYNETSIGLFLGKAHCTDDKDCWNLTKLNLSGEFDKSGYNVDIKCRGRYRKNWLNFGYNETSEMYYQSCRSGDVLATAPECHRDADGRLYCIDNCTRLRTN